MGIKSKIKKIILSTFITCTTFLLVNTNYSFSASLPTSIKATQQGSPMTLISGSGTFAAKTDNDGYALYCLDRKSETPANSNKNLHLTNFSSETERKAITYALQNGLSKYENTNKDTTYMFGTAKDDYYVTQMAISFIVGDRKYSDFKILHGENKYGKKIIALCDDSLNYAKTYSESSNNSKNSKSTVNITGLPTSTVTLTKNANGDFETGWMTANVSNNTKYYPVIKDGPSGSYIDYNPYNSNQFKVVCPSWAVGNTIVHFSVDVTAYGDSTEPTAGLYSLSGYQRIVRFGHREISGGGATTTKNVSLKIDNCDRSELPGQWVVNKDIVLTGNYNVKQGNNNVGILKINNSYKFNPEVKYTYSIYWQGYSRGLSSSVGKTQSEIESEMKEILKNYNINTNNSKKNKKSSSEGCSIDSRWNEACPERPKPAKPTNRKHSETIHYTINYIHEDGTTKKTVKNKTINTGEFNITEDVASKTITGFASNYIPIDVPNIERLVRAEVILHINNVGYTVNLPIEYSYNKDVAVTSINTNFDGCQYIYSDDEISIRANITSNDIRTENFKTDMYVSLNGNSFTKIETNGKTVYGVSSDSIGQVYYKYKVPQKVPGTNTNVTSIQFKCVVTPNSAFPEASGLTGNNTYTSSKITVKDSSGTTLFDDTVGSTRSNYSLSNNTVVSYIKVKKTDKTKKNITYCNGCQLNTTGGSKVCPGHLSYVNGDPYYAFVIKDVNPVTSITEKMEITSVLYRSKYTTEKKGTGKVDSNGFVDITKLTDKEIKKYVRIKSGYGFELKVDTKYTNTIPERMKNVSRTNKASHPNNTTWTSYTFLGDVPQANVVYKNKQSTMSKYLNNTTPVIMLNPSVEELPYSTPNKLFIKLDNGSILTVDANSKLDLVNTSGKTESQTNAEKINYREKIDKDTSNNNVESVMREKSFAFKSVSGHRKYYLSTNTQNGYYPTKIITAISGIRYNCGSKMIAGKAEFDINVYGGYTDDIKTQLNE